jgi:hypothetical protein
MSQLLYVVLALPTVVLAVAIVLAALAAVFTIWLGIAAHLYWKLGRFGSDLRNLKQAGAPDPKGIAIKDRRLDHLWQEYCGTLHLPTDALDPRTGALDQGAYRATVPAESIFNSQSMFEGRIHTEFFKHLPGLFTGLGIIGTFFGLIHGLGTATSNGSLDTTVLIKSVEEAFYVSATAIALAMLVTFFEKILIAGLHRRVERLCQDVDTLFSSGVGEEYLGRLVRASEESAAQARILKDALVGELTAVLERLTQSQIEAAARQQEQLHQNLVATLHTRLMQPLGEMAQGFKQFQGEQSGQLTSGLQSSMEAFASRLDGMLGGQIHQARELQARTLQSLESAAAAFQTLARDVGQAGATATSNMAAGIGGVLEAMAARQDEINTSVRQLADELRGAVAQSQSETQVHLGRIVEELSKQVIGVAQQLHAEARALNETHTDRLAEMTTHAKGSVDALAEGVRAQTAAIEQVTSAVRAAVSDLGSAVGRNVALMNDGAGRMREAAEQFTASGRTTSEVLDRSRETAVQLAQTATRLSSASQDVKDAVGDYRTARETFAGMVDALRATVDVAKRDVALTTDLVARLEAAAQKLVAAQGQADEYLSKVTEVLKQTHSTFTSQMAESLKRANGDFHEHLSKSTSLLASTIAELDGTIIEFSPRRNGAN